MLTILSQYIASIIVVGKVSRGKVSRGKVSPKEGGSKGQNLPDVLHGWSPSYIPVPGPLVYNLYTGPGTVSGFLDCAPSSVSIYIL